MCVLQIVVDTRRPFHTFNLSLINSNCVKICDMHEMSLSWCDSLLGIDVHTFWLSISGTSNNFVETIFQFHIFGGTQICAGLTCTLEQCLNLCSIE